MSTIKDTLLSWERDPTQLAEDGTTTPSVETIRRAIKLESWLSSHGLSSTTRVVATVSGGIVFEFPGVSAFESLHIEPDALIEHRVFVKNRLMIRDIWPDMEGKP